MSPARSSNDQTAQPVEIHMSQRPRTRAYVKQLAGSSAVRKSTDVLQSPLLDQPKSQLTKRPSVTRSKQPRTAVQNKARNSKPSTVAKKLRTQSRSRPAEQTKDQASVTHPPESSATQILPDQASQSAPRRSNRIAQARLDISAATPTVTARPKSTPDIHHKAPVKTRRQPFLTDKTNQPTRTTSSRARYLDKPKLARSASPKRQLRQRESTIAKDKVVASRPARPRASNIRSGQHISTVAEDSVTDWLSRLPADNPQAATQTPSPLFSNMPRPRSAVGGQDTSSSSILNSGTTSSVAPDDTRSGRTDKTLKAKKSFADTVRLKQRFIETISSPDPELDNFGFLEQLGAPIRHLDLHTYKSYVEFYRKNLDALENVLPKTSRTYGFSESDAFTRYENSLQDLLQWRPSESLYRPWPGVLEHQFEIDQLHCLASNEADFQRTSMMSLVDRHDFHDYLTYSCEEQWVGGEYQLPSLEQADKSTMSAPKPDLMICFRGDAIEPDSILRSNVPDSLAPYLWPGYYPDLEKMIPFFFIEVKKGRDSLRSGFGRNLNSASQALYNIYNLMASYPDLVQDFFDKVRVFSLEANVTDMDLRIHRAELHPSGSLMYKFTELKSLSRYTRHHACHLVKCVLLEYALKTLFPIIQTVVQRICEQWPSNPYAGAGRKAKKRKQQTNEANIIAVTEDTPEMVEDIDGDGSQTPRNQGSSTGLTNSFDSRTALKNPVAQPSTKRKKATDAAPRRSRK